MNKFGVNGWIEGRLIMPNGNKKLILLKRNLITDVGLAQIAYLLGNGAAVAFSYGAIGSDGTAPANSDTALGAELDRQSASFSRVTTSVSNDTGQWLSLHTAPVGGWTIREYALVNAASGGVIACRITFSDINLSEGNQFEMIYKLQGQRVS